jgi:hypothetical protein
MGAAGPAEKSDGPLPRRGVGRLRGDYPESEN